MAMVKYYFNMFLLGFALNCDAGNRHIPNEAAVIISKVNAAAQASDFESIQRRMTTDFIWSFGGDDTATQAIEAWKANPDRLKRLTEATNQPCVLLTYNTVECPNNAGLGNRAGFKRTNNGWRMFYFVQGD